MMSTEEKKNTLKAIYGKKNTQAFWTQTLSNCTQKRHMRCFRISAAYREFEFYVGIFFRFLWQMLMSILWNCNLFWRKTCATPHWCTLQVKYLDIGSKWSLESCLASPIIKMIIWSFLIELRAKRDFPRLLQNFDQKWSHDHSDHWKC